MNYLLLVSYDGTAFAGWQEQPRQRTVQGTLRGAAEKIFGSGTAVRASGRTDAGVHALGQIVGIAGECSVPAEKLYACFNRLLPPDVRVLKSAPAAADFDVTRGVLRKTYRYAAYCAPCELPLMSRYAARLPVPVDVERMRAAAGLLLGTHDFSAFRASGFTSKTSEREIYRLEIRERHEFYGTFYEIEVTGNGFLYNMVRILSGELFAVGAGKEEGITRAFQTGERKSLARTMPPQGLTLVNVDYGVPLFGTKE